MTSMRLPVPPRPPRAADQEVGRQRRGVEAQPGDLAAVHGSPPVLVPVAHARGSIIRGADRKRAGRIRRRARTPGLHCAAKRTRCAPLKSTGGVAGARGRHPRASTGWAGRLLSPPRQNRKGRQQTMALPEFSMRQLLEAGVHFGHQTHRWNPKMAPYIFGDRNGIHIIDLTQTVPLLHQALQEVRDVAAGGGRILFVGTKRQAPEAGRRRRQALRPVLREPPLARRHADQLADRLAARSRACASWKAAATATPAASPRRSCCSSTRERDKLEQSLGGIKDMGGTARPDVRDRHQQGSDRDPRSAQARHSGDRHPRHQLATRTASTIRSRATTTRRAPSSSIAT